MVGFYRQMGEQPGVLINRTKDDSVVPTPSNASRVYATAGRFTRGRIDRPIVVTRSNLKRMLGKGEPIRETALNEAWAQIFESLENGAEAAIVQRLIADGFTHMDVFVLKDLNDGSFEFVVAPAGADVGDGDAILKIHHLECHNDGVRVSIHAPSVTDDDGEEQDTSVITVTISDADDNVLFQINGSLSSTDTDDYGNSIFLPDVVMNSGSDALEIEVLDTFAVIGADSAAYGFGKEVKSDVLQYFVEGSPVYTANNLSSACEKLKATPHQYDYVASCGSQSIPLLVGLMGVAYRRLALYAWDIPGSLSPDEAIALMNTIGFLNDKDSYLARAYWAPIKSRDVSGVNPVGYLGTSALNTAMMCDRNKETNVYGVQRRNYPVAGRNGVLPRSGIRQQYFPSSDGLELSSLAKARINPVLFDTFSDGSFCIFTDSLSCNKKNSKSKLVAVADMSAFVDKAVASIIKSALQRPMAETIKFANRILESLFEDLEKSGWIVPSQEPEMDGLAAKFDVRPNPQNPYDAVDISYGISYDGTTRQISISQTIKR